jgi:isochorismate synthase
MTQRRTAIIPNDLEYAEAFRPVLRAAAQRARDLGRPILASLTTRLPEDWSPVSLAGLDPYFVWEQPERGFSLLALGEAAHFTAAGAGRFSSVRQRLGDLTTAAVIERSAGVDSSPLPICLAGFSFDPNRPPAQEWVAFPAALALLPKLLFIRRAGEHYLTLNAVVGCDSNLDEVLEERASLLAIASHAPVPVGAHGRAPLQDLHGTAALPAWRESVLSLTNAIAAGEAEKVVLARRVELRSDGPFDIALALERLRQRYPNCTIFAVRRGDSCFLGATPEMLVRLDNGVVRTDCLAGSARRGATDTEDEAIGRALLADDKERREHAMVVRGLVDSLHAVCVAIDAPSTPSLRKMANVQHLHTPIEATVPGERHVLELVERLHPSPAVGGLPRSRALCLIQENERFDRGWYAGPIGWIDSAGGGEFAVGLRSALVEGDRALLYAGCGIVSGSDPDREYEESRIKLEAMRWALSGKA